MAFTVLLASVNRRFQDTDFFFVEHIQAHTHARMHTDIEYTDACEAEKERKNKNKY